jgi:hypothetical protein
MENVWSGAEEPAPATATAAQPLIEIPQPPEVIPAPPIFPIQIDRSFPEIEVMVDSTLQQFQEWKIHPWGC